MILLQIEPKLLICPEKELLRSNITLHMVKCLKKILERTYKIDKF